jgi:AcrR family transcriptional regulator
LTKVIPAAEALVRADNFSIENLCHAADCSLRELGEAVGTVDDVISHVNGRFMTRYVDQARAVAEDEADDLRAVTALSQLWLDHALANPQNMELLMRHRWSAHFVRPDWYLARVEDCFAPMVARLSRLAPQAAPAQVAGAARGLYAHICGLYFLSSNERAKPAGIDSIKQLLGLTVSLVAKGLAAPA